MSARKRIYCAGKLNDEACDYLKNLHDMIITSEEVRKAGFAVFVPGLDCLMGIVLGTWTYRDFFENSQPWLDASDAVFLGSNWRRSKGTKREIKRALLRGIPVFDDITKMKAHFKKGE